MGRGPQVNMSTAGHESSGHVSSGHVSSRRAAVGAWLAHNGLTVARELRDSYDADDVPTGTDSERPPDNRRLQLSDLGGMVDPDEALAALQHAVDLLSKVDLERLTDRGLLEHTVELDRQATRARAQADRAVADVAQRQAFLEDGCVSAGGWLHLRTRRDQRKAAYDAKLATRLQSLPLLEDAYQAGDITQRHAHTITRAATPARIQAFQDHEDTLVQLARDGTPGELRVAVGHICDVVDDRANAEAGDCSPHASRELHHSRSIDGLGFLDAKLDPVTAERFDNLMAAHDTYTGKDDTRTPSQRRHDAFDSILKAAEEHPHVSRVQGAKPHLLLTIDLYTLLGRDDLASRRPRLGSGAEISPERLAHLVEDAQAKFTALLTWGPFRPLAFGRTQRVLPHFTRPLMHLIHGDCRGPGCDRPIAWTQAAHTQTPWAQGGDTRWETSVPHCLKHHWLLDHAGWTLHHDPDTATCTYTAPDGKTVITTHPPDP